VITNVSDTANEVLSANKALHANKALNANNLLKVLCPNHLIYSCKNLLLLLGRLLEQKVCPAQLMEQQITATLTLVMPSFGMPSSKTHSMALGCAFAAVSTIYDITTMLSGMAIFLFLAMETVVTSGNHAAM
jgi:hypothetical protein